MEMDYYFFWNMNLHGNSTWFWSSFSWKQCEYMFIPITLLQPSGSCVATAGNCFLWPKKTRWPQDSTESPFDRKCQSLSPKKSFVWSGNWTTHIQSKTKMTWIYLRVIEVSIFGGSKHGAKWSKYDGNLRRIYAYNSALFVLVVQWQHLFTTIYYYKVNTKTVDKWGRFPWFPRFASEDQPWIVLHYFQPLQAGWMFL